MTTPSLTDLKHMTQKLLRECSTMTLATASENVPWAAPVYFVYNEEGLYFFSSRKSRHITEALNTGKAAAAVYPDSSSWLGIRGLQMSGKIRDVSLRKESKSVFEQYKSEYSFLRDFFSNRVEIRLNDIVKSFKVRFYCFEPSLVYYLDNSIRFGFRERVYLCGE